jgi:PAS domain-containing protein
MPDADDILLAIRKPVAMLGPRLDVVYANPAFSELLCAGATPDPDACGRAIQATPALVAVLERAVSRLHAAGWAHEARWATSGDDGRVFDIRVTRLAGDRFAAVFDDVTHHVRLQEIQGRARGYLEAILNHLPIGVIVLDAGFNVTYFNQSQGLLFGRLGVERSLFEVIGAPVAESYPVFAPDEWQKVFGRVMGRCEAATWDKVGFPAAQPMRHFAVTVVPLGHEAEPPTGAICMTEDVTRLVALERDLLAKERLALVGHMTIALNHEINSPLTAILGTAESMLFDGGLGGELLARLETIREASLRIVDVTRRLRQVQAVHLTEYVQGGPLMLDLRASEAAAYDGAAAPPGPNH